MNVNVHIVSEIENTYGCESEQVGHSIVLILERGSTTGLMLNNIILYAR